MEATPPSGGEKNGRKIVKRVLGWLTLKALWALIQSRLEDS
ncbi:hypothetical protein [Streptomyces sp. PA5.6]